MAGLFFTGVSIQMSRHRYPVWWDKTITAYVKYENPLTQLVTWHRYVIKNCFWDDTGDKVKIGETVLDSTGILCRIPEQSNYLPKYAWESVPNDEQDKYFTLGLGDILVLGEVDDEINEYVSKKRSSDFIARYKLKGCMEVQTISNSTGAGRCYPHYLARGV